MRCLAELEHLTQLDIVGTSITRQGLLELKRCRSLQGLDVGGATNIARDDIEELKSYFEPDQLSVAQ